MRRSSFQVLMFWGLAFGPVASASGPADDLFRLVPADSGMTLAVEDLRGRAQEIIGSPMFEGLRRLPVVRAWMASGPFRKADKASRDAQAVLGVSLATLRDDLVGDAVVLTFQMAPSGRPDEARGLLLVKPRDRSLIERLLKALNDAQLGSGEQAGLQARSRGPVKYWARIFKAAGRIPEFYVQLDDGTFAWSNSEALILGVIDRKAQGGPNLGDDPDFRKVRRALPDRAVASLFVNARLPEAAMADAPRPPDDRVGALLARYIGAVGQFGLAFRWQDGFSLHSHETIRPEKLDPWLRRWLTRPPSPVTLPARVPPSAIAVLSANLDYPAVLEALRGLIPEDDKPFLENLKLAFQGILLGRDPVTEVLPRLGPGTLVYLEVEPNRAVMPRFPLVGLVGWSGTPGAGVLADPLDNALRTAFAVYALDRTRRPAHLRVESRTIGDSQVTALTNGLRALMAYRVDANGLVVGNSAEAVARFGTGQPPSTILGLRARDFPEAETFAIVDLARIVEEITTLRGPIARALASRSKRPFEATDRDLGDLIALAELFKAATFTSSSATDASEVHRTINLIAR